MVEKRDGARNEWGAQIKSSEMTKRKFTTAENGANSRGEGEGRIRKLKLAARIEAFAVNPFVALASVCLSACASGGANKN